MSGAGLNQDGSLGREGSDKPRSWLDARVPLIGGASVPAGWVVAAGVALVVAGTMWLYHEVVDPLYHADRWSQVTPELLYRSGDPPPYAIKALLDEHEIELVVKLSGHVPDQLHHAKEAEAVEALGIEMQMVPMPGDGRGSVEAYVEALALIHEAQRRRTPTWVHCAAGTHRTGGVVASYRLLFDHWAVGPVYAEMAAHGLTPEVNPDLFAYLNENLPKIAAGLHARGVLPRMPETIPEIKPN